MTMDVDSDLSPGAVREFLAAAMPGDEMVKAVGVMESFEPWTRDREEQVQTALQKFADSVEDYDFQEMSEAAQHQLIETLGYISSGKMIKLLIWIEQLVPNFVARTLAEAQSLSVLDKAKERSAKLFGERIRMLDRLHMLSRIFSEERFAMLTKVMSMLDGRDEDFQESERGYA